jgi:hypothetical protein
MVAKGRSGGRADALWMKRRGRDAAERASEFLPQLMKTITSALLRCKAPVFSADWQL